MFDFDLFWFFIGLVVGIMFGDFFLYLVTLIFKPSYARQYEVIKKQRSKEVNVIVEYKSDDDSYIVRERIWPCSGKHKREVEDGRPDEEKDAVPH